MWALLKVIISLWPRKVGLRGLFCAKAGRAKLDLNFDMAKDFDKLLSEAEVWRCLYDNFSQNAGFQLEWRAEKELMKRFASKNREFE